MQPIETVLADAFGNGVQIWLEENQLLFRAPKGALSSEQLSSLRERKREITEFLRHSGNVCSGPPLRRRGSGERVEVSFAQERLWFLEQLGLVGTAYGMRSAFRLCGGLDEAALERSFEQLQQRHEILRTRFEVQDSRAVQAIDPRGSFQLWREDLSGLDEEVRERQLQKRLQQEIERGFDLQGGPAWRATLVRLGVAEHALLISMHHIISDGWSMGVLERELSELYAAQAQGREAQLVQLPVQYADYALWQRQWLQGEALDSQLSYWKEQLAGAPAVLELPTDRPRPAVASFRGAVQEFELPGKLSEDLLRLGRQEGVTLYMLMLAAFQVLLWRWSGQQDIVVGSPIAGRTRREIEPLIGFFVNTLLLRMDLSGEPSFRELLGRVKTTALGAYAHQELPFERLVAELRPERDLSRQPLFQVMLSVESAAEEGALRLAGMQVSRLRGGWSSSKVDLTLVISYGSAGLRGHVEYATDLFEQPTIERLIGHLGKLLQNIVANPGSRIGELELLTDTERRLVDEWSRATAVPAAPQCLHEMIAEQAAKSPHATAVSCGTDSLSYGELEARANQLAHHLCSLGVRPDVLVALCMERSLEMVIGLLGILKAGGAYVPIDPSYPAERITYLLEDSGAALMVSNAVPAARVGDTVATICMTRDLAQIRTLPTTAPSVRVRPQSLIYCIYTSGSTGKPKGTAITHENVARLLSSTEHLFHFGPQDVWTLFHSFAFDFSVWEIFGALVFGGRLVIVPFLTSRSPEAYFDLLREEGVTVANQTPSAFRLLSRVAEERGEAARPPRLRYVIFGGEALNTGTLEPWAQLQGISHPKLINMYGITETTVHVTYREIGEADIHLPAVSPIGRQIPDLQAHVLDEKMAGVPVGVAGELYVGGPGLARGYHRRPSLTAQRFVPHPSPHTPGERLYRTGDLVRRRADGQLEYLGRIDHQIKLHGFRIELGEIEAAACGCAGVRGAVAAVLGASVEQQRLVCWVCGDSAGRIDTEAVRASLAERLPSFMIPGDIVAVDHIPLTGHGKVDRTAMARSYEPSRQPRDDHGSTRTPLESELVRIWEDVLQTGSIGIRDNFFAVGGDSIRAIETVRAARDRDIPLSVALLFKHQNIADLASVFSGSGAYPLSLQPRAAEQWNLSQEVLAMAQRIDAREVYPVTAMQQLMLDQHARPWHSGGGIYYVQQSFLLEGHEPSVDAMRLALESLVEEHPMLRTVFLRDRSLGGFAQAVVSAVHPNIVEHLLIGCSPTEQESHIVRALEADKALGFDASDTSAPLYRFHWFQTQERACELFMSIHHAIDDGWGNQHFLAQLFERYRRIRNDERISVQPQPNVFREFVALEREMASSVEAAAFWKSQDIVPDGIAHLVQRRREPAEPVRYDTTTTQQYLQELQAACRHAGVSLKAAVLAALAQALRTYMRTDVATIGVVCNGRSDRLSDPLRALGLFWNLVPISLREPVGGTVRERDVQRQLTRIEPMAIYPLVQIERLHEGKDLFYATLNFTNFHNRFNEDVGDGIHVSAARTHDRFHYPLNYHVGVHGRSGVLGVNVEFDTRYFPRAGVHRLTALMLEGLQSRVAVLTAK